MSLKHSTKYIHAKYPTHSGARIKPHRVHFLLLRKYVILANQVLIFNFKTKTFPHTGNLLRYIEIARYPRMEYLKKRKFPKAKGKKSPREIHKASTFGGTRIVRFK